MLYRPLLESEIPEATQVFLVTLADLARRNGLPVPAAYTPEVVQPGYAHLARTGLFWVAEEGGRLVGICAAIVRQQHWFLSMFWVLPEWQGQKVGKPLLHRVWEAGRAQGAQLFSTWSSIDYAALTMYLGLGLHPGGPLLTLSGAADLGAMNRATEASSTAPLELASAGVLDAAVLGLERSVDHGFWLAQPGAVARQCLSADGELIGYFYVRGGSVGPAAWSTPAHAPAVLAHALRAAAEQSSVVKLIAPGPNTAAIAMAAQAGFRVTGTGHWLRSAPFGHIDQYLPSGPALF